jgi:hypothetical protein
MKKIHGASQAVNLAGPDHLRLPPFALTTFRAYGLRRLRLFALTACGAYAYSRLPFSEGITMSSSSSTRRTGHRRQSILVKTHDENGHPHYRTRNPHFFQDLLGLCQKGKTRRTAYKEMVAAADRGEREYPDPMLERLANVRLGTPESTSRALANGTDETGEESDSDTSETNA